MNDGDTGTRSVGGAAYVKAGTVAELFRYPVKSLGGVRLGSP